METIFRMETLLILILLAAIGISVGGQVDSHRICKRLDELIDILRKQ